LKPEWWNSPLAQEDKYQGRKQTCERRKITHFNDDDDDEDDDDDDDKGYFYLSLRFPAMP
jgi:hypothetical protein